MREVNRVREEAACRLLVECKCSQTAPALFDPTVGIISSLLAVDGGGILKSFLDVVADTAKHHVNDRQTWVACMPLFR